VRNGVSENNALTADTTLCHYLTPPKRCNDIYIFYLHHKLTNVIITYIFNNCKRYFSFLAKKMKKLHNFFQKYLFKLPKNLQVNTFWRLEAEKLDFLIKLLYT